MHGLHPALLTAWTSRRAAIDTRRAELSARFQAEHGRTPTVVEALKLAQQATLETREGKHDPRSLGEQRAAWRRQATAVLGGEQELARMLRDALHPSRPAGRRSRWRPTDVAAAAEQVLGTVSAARATWQETHVRAEAERVVRAAGAALPGVDDAVEAIVAAALAPARSVPLRRPDRLEEPAALRRTDGTSVYEVTGAQLYTSAAVLDAEQRILAAAHRRDGRVVTSLTVDLAVAESAANGVELNPGQAQLVRELATSGARVQLALAPAGTGKTTAMAVLARAWRDSGGDVVGLAPSAAAAAVLREEIGGQTDTLAKLLYSLDSGDCPEWVRGIGAGTLVLLDEAGMAGTADLARVLDYVLDRGGSVRLIGDDSQLAAVGAGGVLRDLAETVGAVALSQVMRFTDRAEAAASLALRAGDPTGIAYYLDHSRVHVGDLGTVAAQAYAAWAADRAAGRDAVLLAPTRGLVADLNARARADRLAADGPAGAEVQLADGSRAGAGDLISTGRNDRRIPISATDWVKNGDRWRVAAVDSDGSLRVAHLPTGRRVHLPAGYVGRHVALGYATTVHAAQGITADACHTVVTGAETRQLLYVALTRGRHRNSLYLATGNDGDPHAVITRDALLPPTAVDVLTRVLAADGAQASAITTRRALHDPAHRLAQAADAYYDAVTTAAELHLGPDWVTSIDAAAETVRPGLPSAPAFPTLRAHLALLTLDGDDPAAVLRDAIISRDLNTAADVAAVLDWRLDPSGGHSATAGPLSWLPAVPRALADDPAWAAYLARRDSQVRTLAAAVEEHSRSWTPSDAPGWARPLLYRDPRLLARLAVWRAAQRVAADDPTLTGPARPGPAQRRAADARAKRALDDRAEAVLGDPAAPARRWAPVADAINPRLGLDPYWPQLADRLTAAARAGIDIATLATRVAAERPLPDEMPAGALWWRLAGHLSPAALDAAGTSAPDTLRPAWTPTLASILGQATAGRVVADHSWPALVAAVTTAGAAGWTAADALCTAHDLLAGGTDDDTPLAADQLCQALAWRIRLLSDPSYPNAATAPLDDPAPLEEPELDEDERPSAEDIAWLDTADTGGRNPAPPRSDITEANGHGELDPWLTELIARLAAPHGADHRTPDPQQAALDAAPPFAPNPAATVPGQQDIWHREPTRDRLLELNRQAAAFFTDRHPESWAPRYLQQRLGTDLRVDPRFTPGYAPADWTALVKPAPRRRRQPRGTPRRRAGHPRPQRAADRPVLRPARTSHQQRVWRCRRLRRPPARTRRRRSRTQVPDTAVFRKGDCLYGAADATDGLAGGAVPVLVEGPLDAIAVTLAGDGQYVGLAPLGTAFTDPQADQLRAYLRRNTLVATDNDPAGRVAAIRAYWRLVARGDNPQQLLLPDGLDPAALLHTAGPAALRGALHANTRPLAHAVIDERINRYASRLHTAEGVVAATRAAAEAIAPLHPEQSDRSFTQRCKHDSAIPRSKLFRDRLLPAGEPTPRPGGEPQPAWHRHTDSSSATIVASAAVSV